MATLTSTITESITLNGQDRGSTNTLSVASVTQVFHRIVTCPANNDTTVATFQTETYTTEGAIDLEDVKYIRVTNLDGSNELVLSLQTSNDEDGTADGSTSLLIDPGRSFIMGVPHEGIANDDDADTPITDSNLHDLESLIIDPKGNAISVEVFIAS
jgi:hypothetical protein